MCLPKLHRPDLDLQFSYSLDLRRSFTANTVPNITGIRKLQLDNLQGEQLPRRCSTQCGRANAIIGEMPEFLSSWFLDEQSGSVVSGHAQ